MRKLELLIEENSFGAVRPVEVVANAPVAVLVPALVKELQLPQTDLFGKRLVYTLRRASDADALPAYETLMSAGITPGTRLALDSYAVDGGEDAGAAVSRPLQADDPLQFLTTPQSSFSVQSRYAPPLAMHTSETVADSSVLTAFGRNDTPAAGYVPIKARKNKGKGTRRAFLFVAGIVLGAGGAGVGYAAYMRFVAGKSATQPTTQKQIVQKVATPPATAAPKPTVPKMATTLLSFTRHQQTVRGVDWSPDGTQLVSGADDSQVFVWGTAGNVLQQIKHPGAVRAVAWSPDNQRIVTGSLNQVAFYNVQSGKQLALSTKRHTGTVNSVAWTPHNLQQVVTGANDLHAIVWETINYQAQITFMKHTAAIDMVAWAADGQTIASSSQGGVVRVWNAETGNELHGYYQDAQVPMRALAFNPTSMQLSVGGDDGVVRFWQGSVCQQQMQVNGATLCGDIPQRLHVSTKAVRSLAWSPDGRFLAVGSDDNMLTFWYPAQSQTPLFSVPLKDTVHSLAWKPNSNPLQLAAAVGTTVMIWKLA